MADPFFARPVKALRDSGIPNTIVPAAGMGLTLDHNGRVPLQAIATPLYAVVATSETYNTGSYGNPATTGPTIMIAQAGSYLLLYGAQLTTTGTLADLLRASPSIAGATPADADAAAVAFIASGGVTAGASVSSAKVVTGSLPGDVITLQYKRVNNSISVANRWLLAIPLF